jgi:hypothetical protein
MITAFGEERLEDRELFWKAAMRWDSFRHEAERLTAAAPLADHRDRLRELAACFDAGDRYSLLAYHYLDEKIEKTPDCELVATDFFCFRPGGMLNDNVINAALAMLSLLSDNSATCDFLSRSPVRPMHLLIDTVWKRGERNTVLALRDDAGCHWVGVFLDIVESFTGNGNVIIYNPMGADYASSKFAHTIINNVLSSLG